MEELQLALIVFSLFVFQFIQHTSFHNSRKKIVKYYVLVMETYELLYVLKLRIWMVLYHAIVKTMEKPLELGNDSVLVVARITYQRASGRRIITRQVCGSYVRLSGADRFPTQKGRSLFVVHIGLIIRPTAINVVEIQSGRSKIGQRIGVILRLQAAGRIESDVVVDKLAEVGVQRRNGAFFRILPISRGIKCRSHRLPKLCQIGHVILLRRTKRCRWQ